MTTRETFVGTIRGLRVFRAGAQLIAWAGYRAGLRAKLGRHGFRYREPDPMGRGFWVTRFTFEAIQLLDAGSRRPAQAAPGARGCARGASRG